MKQSINYQVYEPGVLLEKAFPEDKIPLLQMQHLRMLDFPISRNISYERTVDEFLLQLATNDSLRGLRNRKDLVILLNEEGAIIRENGAWFLIFTPGQGEQMTLDEDAALYGVLRNLMKKEKEQKVCRVRIPARSLRTLVSGIAPFSILDEYCRTQPGGYLAVAERIVYEGPDLLLSHVPVCRYGSLVTVDKEEIEKYNTIKSLLDDYIYRFDHAEGEDKIQPLSIAVFGAPGCGKSFGVKQIAGSSGRFSVSSLNLSQYNSQTELFEALREVLQYKNSLIPLVFFDEFDSELNGVSRGWLKYFLAPMQDGEYTLNGRTFDISGAVFVFAGATATSFKGFLPSTPAEEEQFAAVKGTDFVSRLKGILNIKGPNPTGVTDKSHVIRRAMLFREIISRNIPGIYDQAGSQVNISKSLLSALLSVSEYRHGTRSLEFILAMSRLSGVRRFTPSCLPLDEQLDIHLNVKDFQKKLAFEQIMGDMVGKYAEIAHSHYRKQRLAEMERMDLTENEEKAILAEPEMAPWDKLDEFYKEGHRSQIRYLGEELMSYDMNIGLRPCLPEANDAVTELYGPLLEDLSMIEHERWIRDKQADGYKLGKRDNDLKLNPELVPFTDLDPDVQEFIRNAVRSVPAYLKEIGYELYRKSY